MFCEQDFPELLAIRAQLAAKYGKEFINEASSDISCLKWNVNENMIRCVPAAEYSCAACAPQYCHVRV